jgi:tetratricopeptide (TPR) repeat protein
MVTMMNDRYFYFPMIGIAGLAGHLTPICQDHIRPHIARKLTAMCAIVVVLLLAYTSHVRGRVWQNSITLFSDAVLKAPQEFNSYLGLAEAYRVTGNDELARQYYNEASKHGLLSSAVSNDLARYYLSSGELDKAYGHIWGVLLKDSTSKEGLLLLGEYYAMKNDFPAAEKKLLTYLESTPNSIKGLYILGKVYFMTGNYENARKYYQKSIDAGGNDADIYVALSCLESGTGHVELSYTYMKTALQRGYSKIEQLKTDHCFSTLRQDSRFKLLLNQGP